MSVAFSTAGFSGSIDSITTSSDAGGVDAVEEELRVERDGDVGALVLRLDRLVRLADVLRDRRQLEALRAHRQPDRARCRWLCPTSRTRLTAACSASRDTVSRFG